MEPALLQQRVVRWGPNIQAFVLFIVLNHHRRNRFKFIFSPLFFVVAWRTRHGTSCSVWACHRQIQAEITFTGWSKYLRQQWTSTPSWWGRESKTKEWMLGKIVELPVKAVCYCSLVINLDDMKCGSRLSWEPFLFLCTFFIGWFSHGRNPAWRKSPFLASRGRCTSTPEWILIKMKLWSKCGWRSSLSHCCTLSPSTSYPASAPRTSAAPPTRLCTSEPVKPPLIPDTLASHPHVPSCRVKELSHHFSEMNPVRQKWIYTFFMYPFLSGDRIDGKRAVKRQLKYVV